MDVIVLIGRILFVALFIGSAFGHLFQSEGMGSTPRKAYQRPAFW